jgi:hypothetical protein
VALEILNRELSNTLVHHRGPEHRTKEAEASGTHVELKVYKKDQQGLLVRGHAVVSAKRVSPHPVFSVLRALLNAKISIDEHIKKRPCGTT